MWQVARLPVPFVFERRKGTKWNIAHVTNLAELRSTEWALPSPDPGHTPAVDALTALAHLLGAIAVVWAVQDSQKS